MERRTEGTGADAEALALAMLGARTMSGLKPDPRLIAEVLGETSGALG